MITKLRIPTQDQFAFLEIEFEGTADEAYREYRRVSAIVQGGEGLPDKEFNEVLDIYLTTKQIPNGADLYEKMNPSQQAMIQTIKRSFARTKND